MTDADKQILIEKFTGYISDSRKELMDKVLETRTHYVSVVLENLFQSHNANAVIRSCDCFGILDVHIIENEFKYEVNRQVSMGSAKWVDVYRYNEGKSNTRPCIEALRQKGYLVVATSPHPGGCTIEELPLDQPVALMFGTEQKGLTPEALALADRHVRIPLYGFTDSFNISVSAALCLYELTRRLHASDLPWRMSESEALDLRYRWYKQSVRAGDLFEKQYLEEKEANQ